MDKPVSDKSSASGEQPEKAVLLPEKARPKEAGGPKGLEPTRYGDWERKGITSDF